MAHSRNGSTDSQEQIELGWGRIVLADVLEIYEQERLRTPCWQFEGEKDIHSSLHSCPVAIEGSITIVQI